MNRRFFFCFTLMLGLFVALGSSALAEGMIHTGGAVRTKSVGPFTAKVYAIRHDMKERPPTKSKQAMIDADVDKQFTWHMLRDVEALKIKNALREAFKMNGYADTAKIEQFVAAFGPDKEDVKEWEKGKPASVVIFYSAANKTVSISVAGKGSATVAGQDFMKGVWSIWFGKIDQPSIGDGLMSLL
jgi:hypothetical protein